MTPDWQDETPTADELRARDVAVARCRAERSFISVSTAKGDSYADIAARGWIKWGINGGSKGFCIAQGRAPVAGS